MAVCVAVIDKQNAPVFLQCAPNSKSKSNDHKSDHELKLHYTVHSSLDIVDEKLNVTTPATGSRSTDLRELYLGLLLSTEEYKVYGYATNTKIKFILVVELNNNNMKDQEVRGTFKKLHNLYCDLVASPSFIPGAPLNSQRLTDLANEILGIL